MITDEQMNALKPEGFDDTAWGKLSQGFMKLHESDIVGLQNNSLKLKQEKVDALEKFHTAEETHANALKAFETEKASLNSQIEELKKNSPESIKAAYEAKQKELTDSLNSIKEELASQIAEKDKEIETLRTGVFQRDCVEAFEKAIQGKNIDSSTIQDIRQFIMGDNYSKFSRTNMGDGQTAITREDGKDIASAVEEFFATPTGKRFLINGNTGGGADGNKEPSPGGRTTMSRAEFDAITDPVAKVAAAKKYTII